MARSFLMGVLYGSLNYTTSGRRKRINRKRQVNNSFAVITANTANAKAGQNSNSYRRETTYYPSSSKTNCTSQVAAKPETKVYTGTLVKGIGTMHKSNAVPVINQEEMKDIARMRR
jgi:hypothetical protein